MGVCQKGYVQNVFKDCNLNKKIEKVSWNLNILATKSYV